MEIFMLLTHSLDNDDNADEDDNDDTDKKNQNLHSDGSYNSVDVKQLIELKVHWIQHYSTEETNMEGYTSIFLNIFQVWLISLIITW